MNQGDGEDCGVPALLLAGGLGTRLRPLTDRVPKCLVPIDGRPLLDYWFDRFQEAGIQRVRINNHHLPDQVRVYIDEVNSRGFFRVEEAYEPKLLGSAGTVTANRDLADGARDVLIVYGDNLSSVDLGAMLRYHRSHDDPFTMLLFHAPVPETCGIAQMGEDGRIVAFIEKPEKPASDLANAGVYVVSAEAYREIADMGGFDLGFDVLPRFSGRMRGFAFDGYHRDIGSPEALELAQREVAEALRGRVGGAR